MNYGKLHFPKCKGIMLKDVFHKKHPLKTGVFHISLERAVRSVLSQTDLRLNSRKKEKGEGRGGQLLFGVVLAGWKGIS